MYQLLDTAACLVMERIEEIEAEIEDIEAVDTGYWILVGLLILDICCCPSY